MADLIKIREVSLKYSISTRSLRYYEDMGLLQSTKSDDYAYRCYDEKAIARLEQILILRKLNISIKDIQRIFSSNSAGTLLEVLSNKVNDIDEEAALLHELKEIVLEFIKQIEKIDFSKEADIKLLYEKANEIEKRLTNVEKVNNPTSIGKLVEITERLEKEPEVRIVRMPAMPMFLSPHGNPEAESGVLQDFYALAKKELFNGDDEYPYAGGLPIFAWDDGEGFRFLIKKPINFTNTFNWEEYEFPGGLYLVFSAWLPEMMDKYQQVLKWLEHSTLYKLDEKAEAEGRYVMGHIITPFELREKLNNEQQDVFVPICLK
ncbi:MerR family transcriptional regulator [Lutispora saccharofermentans]|uniref:MerR family transcriptional regulator n=1 Tax=Lutispora saccharofermentans TaxID=3024236 RepID=A0ABT1NFB1_9FIRM|nr:MerR family transcriptional regulator [Lutispora saccharofermentans]MCQ1529965.1 MerR family transcriptional regulator [Lutispora saccharofermentans]